jgi:hypothetical protein
VQPQLVEKDFYLTRILRAFRKHGRRDFAERRDAAQQGFSDVRGCRPTPVLLSIERTRSDEPLDPASAPLEDELTPTSSL